MRRPMGASALPLTDIDDTVELAQKAEAGPFDSIFLGDVVGLWNDVRATPFNRLEPITTLAAVSMATRSIGMIATASTTYRVPYNRARQFSSLDHISRGRAGRNIVTPLLTAVARMPSVGRRRSWATRLRKGK